MHTHGACHLDLSLEVNLLGVWIGTGLGETPKGMGDGFVCWWVCGGFLVCNPESSQNALLTVDRKKMKLCDLGASREIPYEEDKGSYMKEQGD
eukprot:1392503-Amorphochlora_amoeboformis.AAC.2